MVMAVVMTVDSEYIYLRRHHRRRRRTHVFVCVFVCLSVRAGRSRP